MKQLNNILTRFNEWAKANPEFKVYEPIPSKPSISLFNRLKRFFSSK